MSRIKRCFTSRFGGGCIIEADVAQLEIVAAAYLSQDLNLLKDITSGLDLHCLSLSLWKTGDYHAIHSLYLKGEKETTKLRKTAKFLSFRLLYGSGYKSLAKQFNLSEKDAKAFIDNYYARYKGLKQWQNENITAVGVGAEHEGEKTSLGVPAKTSRMVTKTGRRFVFVEDDPRDWMRFKGPNFNPAKIKNYPVQGFATGDLFQLMLGKMFRWVRANYPGTEHDGVQLDGELLLVNTVHDSILFDYGGKNVRQVSELIRQKMELIGMELITQWGIDIRPLEIKVNVEWGPNWGDLNQSL
jgi:DNA polymerase I-like protein with 3'-5' exonuclease and polymerase domains|tara:strand:- start:5808 stop:6704 length:897 start_codon:yes stop_codon:yes gene_type:complete